MFFGSGDIETATFILLVAPHSRLPNNSFSGYPRYQYHRLPNIIHHLRLHKNSYPHSTVPIQPNEWYVYVMFQGVNFVSKLDTADDMLKTFAKELPSKFTLPQGYQDFPEEKQMSYVVEAMMKRDLKTNLLQHRLPPFLKHAGTPHGNHRRRSGSQAAHEVWDGNYEVPFFGFVNLTIEEERFVAKVYDKRQRSSSIGAWDEVNEGRQMILQKLKRIPKLLKDLPADIKMAVLKNIYAIDVKGKRKEGISKLKYNDFVIMCASEPLWIVMMDIMQSYAKEGTAVLWEEGRGGRRGRQKADLKPFDFLEFLQNFPENAALEYLRKVRISFGACSRMRCGCLDTFRRHDSETSSS